MTESQPQQQQQQQQQHREEAGSIQEEVHNDTQDHVPHRIIAIAVDQSSFSEHAFEWAVKNFINPSTDQVVLLNVRPYVTAPVLYAAPMMDLGVDFMLTPDEYSKLDEANKTFSHNLIRKYAQTLIKKNIKCKGVALRGDPREEIVYKVHDLKADALIIGSRGMGLLKRTFVGSVSDYCVHHCHCTVIIPRDPETSK